MSSPAWSPDGTLIAFSLGLYPPKGIAVIRPDGTGMRVIARGDLGQPTWSPDGRQLAVVAGSSIDVMSSAGGPLRTILTLPKGMPWSLSWRSDGREIAFAWDHLSLAGLCFGKPHGIYEVAPSGGAPKQLTTGCDSAAAWSPDGSRLAFLRQWVGSGRPGLFTIPAEGGPLHRVWNGCFPPVQGRRDCQTGGVALAWSPDAKQFVFSRADAYIINADGSGLHEIPGFGKLRFYADGVSWAH
jgi:Tol biopolymer transport system component